MSNNLNDISKIYLDQIANINKKDIDKDVERWTQTEAVKGEDSQSRKDAAIERRTAKRLPPSEGKNMLQELKLVLIGGRKKLRKNR